jgi:multiple antibiotic resistance protein
MVPRPHPTPVARVGSVVVEILLVPFLKAVVLLPATLLPIINPLSTAPVFVATVGADHALAQRLARQVAINSWFIVFGSIAVGTYVLQLFGISLPVVRLGGGLLVASTAWGMLNRAARDEVQAAVAGKAIEMSESEVISRSFFPITFPLTTGPGTIAASIALGAKIPATPVLYVMGTLAAAVGAFLVSAALYLILANSVRVVTRLGEVGMLVLTRLMAFLLLCIGIEIMWSGWAELNGLPG